MLGLEEEVEGAFGSESIVSWFPLKRVAAVEGSLSVLADYIGPIIRVPTASSRGAPAMIQEGAQAVMSCGQHQVLAGGAVGSRASGSGADVRPARIAQKTVII